MDAKELRLYNYVWNQNKMPMLVREIDEKMATVSHPESLNTLIRFPIKYLNPIPITEGWLKRFGFLKSINWFNKNDFQLTLDKCEGGGFYNDELDLFIKHVHQFQNLFFILTGKELELKHTK